MSVINIESIFGHETRPVQVQVQDGNVLFVDYYKEWAWFGIRGNAVCAHTAADTAWAERRFGPNWADVMADAAFGLA